MSDVVHKYNFTYLKSVNTGDHVDGNWLINPDLSAIVNIPQKYWKYDELSESIVEMSQSEKQVVDGVNIEVIKLQNISTLWNNYNNYCESQFDVNSRDALIWVAISPDTPQEKLTMISQIRQWWQTLWTNYGIKKAMIQAGQQVNLECEEPPVPYTIWQIVS